RTRERDARRAEREREREARHAGREARREERRRFRAEFQHSFGEKLGERLRHEIHSGLRGWAFGFGDVGPGGGGASVSDVEEKRFTVQGMPKVRVSNVAGEIDVSVGSANEVFVRARKRVEGWSEDRARRLLENVEIVMEQNGDEIVIEPRMFQ